MRMTLLFVGISTLSTLGCGDPAPTPSDVLERARKDGKWDEPAEPTKIVGPIYYVGTKGLGCYLIKSSEGLVLINTAMPGSGPMIETAIRKLGFDPNEIKLLLTGHAHLDHVGGHAYLQKLSGAKVGAIEQEKALLESGGTLDFHYGAEKGFRFDPVHVDRVFADGDVLKVGDVAIKALLTAGHTRGSTTFVVEVHDGGKSYTVVFPASVGINSGYRLVKNPSYPGIADDYRRSLDTLQNLEPDVWLFPHIYVDDFATKRALAAVDGAAAWVDPEGYRRWLADQREAFEEAMQ